MKSSILICVGLVVGGAANAQSSMTLFGVVDVAYNSTTNKSTNVVGQELNVSRHALNNSGYQTSRIGFRGSENLGGGISAEFWLESVLTNDDGVTAMLFTRRSTVSITSPLGEIRLGRDYTPTFNNDTLADPFGTVGIGASLVINAQNLNITGGSGGFGGNPNYLRASNAIHYLSPNFSNGLYGNAMYVFHEQTQYGSILSAPADASVKAGKYVGGRIGYAKGSANVAVAYGESVAADSLAAGTRNTIKTTSLAGTYDFGVLKLIGGLSKVFQARDSSIAAAVPLPETNLSGYVIGINIPIGVGLVRASYSAVKYDYNEASTADNPKAHKLALGYVHNLSKRTAIFTTIAKTTNKSGAALTLGGPAYTINGTYRPSSSFAYDFGVRHSF